MKAAAKKTAKPAAAISTRLPAVDVEYDARGARAVKHFEDANEAKRFYAAKDKAGKNPKVIGDAPAPAPAADDKPAAVAKPAKTAQPKAVKPAAMPKKFIAGVLPRKHGLDANLDALVAEADRLAGTNSPVQTRYDLQHALNAIRGWLSADGN